MGQMVQPLYSAQEEKAPLG